MWIWWTEKAVIPICHNWVKYADSPLEEEAEEKKGNHRCNFHPSVPHSQ